MALVAGVENGKIVESASQSSLSKTKEASANNGMDKDAFLQLLVAQMKYQDPMEPTSNTEYIAQYAQFSQVEQMQNMSASMDLQRASQLVGQEVYIKTTGSTGDTKYVQGKVDYVVYENNKAYLSIDESLYSIDDLDTVVDSTYKKAYDQAMDFAVSINKLPNLATISGTDMDKVDSLKAAYDAMNDYEKSYVASDVVATLNKYVDKVKEVRLAAEEAAEKLAAAQAAETDETTETAEV
ncbi:MAG: flagellar hook capping protein [Lachnospiraceae bacterium]|nr:flagellar hook capping protein [Lachnospiraceae bacterium]